MYQLNKWDFKDKLSNIDVGRIWREACQTMTHPVIGLTLNHNGYVLVDKHVYDEAKLKELDFEVETTDKPSMFKAHVNSYGNSVISPFRTGDNFYLLHVYDVKQVEKVVDKICKRYYKLAKFQVKVSVG